MLDAFESDCKNAISHLYEEYKTVRTGRATVDMVDGVTVEAYGADTPLNGVASISVSDPKTLLISPWDTNLLSGIEKAIQKADLGINPMNDGNVVKLVIPELSEERRNDLVKQVNTIGENAKVSIRNSRRKVIDDVKKQELSEDEERRKVENIDDMLKKYTNEIEEVVKVKEKDLMTI